MNKIRRIATIALCVATLGSMSAACYANNNAEVAESSVTPRYVAISVTSTGCEWGTGGKAICSAATEVWDGYIAGVTAELQQYKNGKWTTLVTWTDTDWDYASIEANYYVDTNYDYRVKSTHYSYDSNWNQLESVVKYSDII